MSTVSGHGVALGVANANALPGYGYHADFMTGWEPKFLQHVLDNCTSDIGNLEQCDAFTILDPSVQAQCTMKKMP